MLDIDQAYNEGAKRIKEEHDANEETKVGILRGGSAGLLLYGKTPVGNCARKAYLRFKGLNLDDIDENRYLMFDAGLANEDIWAKILEKGLPSGFSLKREEEVPAVWELPSGTKVTGRPDIVLFQGETPIVGIELKLVSALWTARDILGEDTPKLLHLIQAGHYARILGIPWELWYTSRADFAVSRESWMQKLFTKVPDEYADKRINKTTGKEEINKILPFRRGYRLFWEGDQLLYQRVGGEEVKHSIVTWSAIEAFYETIDKVDSKGILPPRPANINALGKEGGYNICDPLYCTLSETCDKYETSLKKWVAAVTLIAK